MAIEAAQVSPVPANRLRTARERAIAIRKAWDALTAWEARFFADVMFLEVSQSEPIPPFAGILAEARDWASFASFAELEAYALACFERMAPERQAAFLTYAQRRRAV